VPYELAREIATREGAKALLDGSISQLGQSYVITARLASALDGADLATFREEAATEDELLGALGRLSKEVRAKAGESLKSIRASSELERVTTPSLPALRKYVEGSRQADELGEIERGIAMLREAVQLDTAFAMAWRKLAVLLNNEGRDRAGMLEAVSTAYRHRDRLTEMERLLTEGFYYTRGPSPDREKALAAYEEAAKLDSLSTSALNNAAVILGELNENDQAEALYRRVVNLPHTFGGAFSNLLQEQIHNGRSAAALDSTVARYRATFPESNDLWEAEWFAARGKEDLAAADSIARAVHASAKTVRQVIRSSGDLTATAELRGQIADAIEWQRRSSEALYKVQPTPGNLLSIALDSVYYQAMYGEKATALATLARARARIPMSEIPPSERPWGYLKFIGSWLREPGLVREATAGFERDQLSLSSDPEGRRADFATSLALSEERWEDAIRFAREAERRFSYSPRIAAIIRGLAYRGLGQPDSAIAAYEQFLTLREPALGTDGQWRARVLEWLGEQYEAKGNRAKAIESYSQFTELWKDADPMLQPKVREIRDRIARLQAETG
jgi:tetratricopeptide (TPR) repeat protein